MGLFLWWTLLILRSFFVKIENIFCRSICPSIRLCRTHQAALDLISRWRKRRQGTRNNSNMLRQSCITHENMNWLNPKQVSPWVTLLCSCDSDMASYLTLIPPNRIMASCTKLRLGHTVESLMSVRLRRKIAIFLGNKQQICIMIRHNEIYKYI